MAYNSTPSTPSCTIRATAFHPPPPTPITLIRVPRRASSSISYFRSSISESISPIFTSLAQSHLATIFSFQDLCQPSGGFLLVLKPALQLGRVHGKAGG